MKFRTVAQQFAVTTLALAVAVGCSSTATKEDEAAATAAVEQAEADANAAAAQAEADAAAAAAAAQAEADAAAARAEAEAQAAAASVSSGNDYTVVGGDNLWSIAGQGSTYGNPYAWPLIYKANKSQINDADLIFPGQVFAIEGASSAELDAAIQHAKTRGAWSIGEVEASDQDYLAQ